MVSARQCSIRNSASRSLSVNSSNSKGSIMSGRLEGKVAIITGAGSGIGRAAALLFADAGAKLVLGDKTQAVHETARQVIAADGHATALQIDAGVESDVANIVASA